MRSVSSRSPATTSPALVTSDGRVWSWRELVDEFRPAIEGFARSRGIRDAGDVAGDVFAAAVPQLDGFRGTSRDLRSFLFTLAHRRVADEHRRFYRRPERLTGTVPDVPAPNGPQDEVLDRHHARSAFAALSILDERSQQVLLLRIVDERSTEEVAGKLGLSTVNVRKIQSRALRQVRRHLEKFRHNSAGRAMALVVAPLLRFRCETALPTDGPVGEWIVALRAEAAAAGAHSAAEAAALATAATAASGALAVVSTTTTTTVAATAVTGGILMKTNLTLSVLAAAAAAVSGGAATNTFDTDTSARAAGESAVEINDESRAADGVAGMAWTDINDVPGAAVGAAATVGVHAEDRIDAVAITGAAAIEIDNDATADVDVDVVAAGSTGVDDEFSARAETRDDLDVSLGDVDDVGIAVSTDTEVGVETGLGEVDAAVQVGVEACGDDVEMSGEAGSDTRVAIGRDDAEVSAGVDTDLGISIEPGGDIEQDDDLLGGLFD